MRKDILKSKDVNKKTERETKKAAEQKLLDRGWKKVDEGCYIDKSKRNDLYGHLMGDY